jgi:hypothetical protein
MIKMCSLFDLVVKIQFVHGGKVFNFPMLNSTFKLPLPNYVRWALPLKKWVFPRALYV